MNTLPEKVVLDSKLLETFFCMAAQEGLLVEENRMDRDSFLRRYLEIQPPQELKRLVLEQIVLTPKIIIPGNVPIEQMDGPLIDRGMLEIVETPTDDNLKIQKISNDFLSAMLQAKGYSIPKDDIQPRVDAAMEALQEEDEYRHLMGEKPPSEISIFMRQALGGDPYPETVVKDVERRNSIYEKARPIFNTVMEYNRLATLSEELNILMRVPTNYNPNAQLVDNLYSGDTDIALVRVASNKMGKLTYRDSMKESIALADHSNTAAFRKQLNKWKENLERGDLDTIEQIQRDVEEASRELAKLSTWDSINRIATYVAVPVTAIELFTFMPPVLGVTFTVVGFASTAITDVTKRKYKWAMFGEV